MVSCNIEVEFIESLPFEKIVSEFGNLNNPQIIIWYIGHKGLKKNCVEYYNDNIILPIIKKNIESTFWLIDLTAWNAFKNISGSINKKSSVCTTLENFQQNNLIKYLTAAEIFNKMKSISSSNIIEYFQQALSRDFIVNSSKSFSPIGVTVKDLMENNCPIVSNFYDWDVSNAYSVFQYLEGCFIIKEIISRFIKNNSSNNYTMVFLLPNDELKYYKDDQESFKKDLDFFLSQSFNVFDELNFPINIKFYSFTFGDQMDQRPYNLPGKVIKKNQLKVLLDKLNIKKQSLPEGSI